MPISSAQLAELEAALGAAALIGEPWRMEAYAADELQQPWMPDLVVEPREVEQIRQLLHWANRHGVPVTPRGAGTGLSGGALALRGGVILSLLKFNRILEIDPINQLAVVEPGVINLDLQRAVEAQGLFYPPDPASWDSSTIGGNVAEDAGGPRCLKYGVTRSYVLQLEAVLPDGGLIVCGARTRKGVVGYSLRDLLIGSEGTLAVVVKIVLRLLPRPKALRTLLALLPDFASAARLAAAVPRAGLLPCALEFLDDHALDLVRGRLPLRLPEACRTLLLLEVDGDAESVERQALELGGLCLEAGALDVLVAQGEEQRTRLWEVRRALSPTTRELFAQKLSEDVAVPLSRLEEYLVRSREAGERRGLTVLGYGHLGDGNVHTNVLSRVAGEAERRRMWDCVGEIFRLAIELGGTLSAEHGIGCWKQPFIDLELDAGNRELQKRIKRLFDPNDILNPGKIFDWPGTQQEPKPS
jgi:glycolate oxidase